MEQYHYIYKITDTVTGQYYIGMRSCNVEPELDSYMGSGDWIKDQAMIHGGLKKRPNCGYKKHFESTKHIIKEIVEHCGSREEASYRENILIDCSWHVDPLCMNKMMGGSVGNTDVKGEKNPRYNSALYHFWDEFFKIDFKATKYEMRTRYNDKDGDLYGMINGKSLSYKNVRLYKNKDVVANRSSDKTKYKCFDRKTKTIFYATQIEIRNDYGINGNIGVFLNKGYTINNICLYEYKDVEPKSIDEKFHVWDHKSGTEYILTIKGIAELSERKYETAHSMVKGISKTCNGFCLYENKDKPYGYASTAMAHKKLKDIRCWNHITQTEFTTNQYDLQHIYKLSANSASLMCNNKLTVSKGICLYENKDKPFRKTW